MKNIIVNYKVYNDKISDKNIVLLSDLHNYNFKNSKDFIDKIKIINPDLIAIAGDICRPKNIVKGSNSQREIKDFLKQISETSPVVLGLGNHDLFESTTESEDGYKDLENANPGKVFPLSNESIEFDDIRVSEFHPDHDAFSPSIQENGSALIKFEEQFSNCNLDCDINDKKYNIMLCHNPKIFSQARCVGEQLYLQVSSEQTQRLIDLSKKVKQYNLVLSGHLHNGYIPLSKTIKNPERYMDEGYWEMGVERDIDNNILKIRPWILKKTNMCRGTIFVGDTETKIIELCDGKYYFKRKSYSNYIELSEKKALDYYLEHNMTPIVVSGGVNKYFGLPVDSSEITQVKILKK